MSKLKRLTATVTPGKNRPEKPFLQIEGELIEAQLEAIGFASARREASTCGLSLCLGRSAIAAGEPETSPKK